MSLRRNAVAVMSLAAFLAGCADVVEPTPRFDETPAPGARGIVVMTRNIYLGTELTGLLQISNPNLIPPAVAQIWANIQATNFPARAGLLAAEIEATGPHLIGLQEATEYRKQSP